ncbi:MAG: zinc ribbon domain-containing protein [Gemmatimonadetes bacterium]|nr:zinc ribbon domain-containing protein [Gemmatimonadota bacterium]
MTNASSASCPRCGKPAAGKFCAHCGSTLQAATCPDCNSAVEPGSRFCNSCGAPIGDAPRSESGSAARNPVMWIVPCIALLAVIAYFIGQQYASKGDASAGATPLGAAGTAPFASGGAGGAGGAAGTDITQMSPEERASRLFDRVMRYGEQGKLDSARIFAPMAMQAYEMIGEMTPHAHYDVGMIAFVAGDANIATAQADTILKADKNHLLGLILAAKAAGLRNDTKARTAYEQRFATAAPSELAKKIPEYEDHKADVDAMLAATKGSKPKQ